MTETHFFGNYEISEETTRSGYTATVKIHNAKKRIDVSPEALVVMAQQATDPQIVVHNIVKQPNLLKDHLVISAENLKKYL